MMSPKHRDNDEPTAADLAAIEAEWPLIEAELSALDAQIRILTAAGGLSSLDWRRLRRAERRVLAARRALAAPAADVVRQVAS
jgi:hypothetical protein